jgi:uncharacterized membrane protein
VSVLQNLLTQGETLHTTNKPTRLWEIDTLRGIAIVLMICFHFVWDLDHFAGYEVNVLSAPWQTFARSIASLFIFVMGVSLTLSYNRAKQQAGHSALFIKYLRRGGQIFGLGMVITVGTYFFFEGQGFVIFGILHLLGLSIILAYPFLRYNKWVSLLAGLLAIGLGIYLNGLVVSFPWLIWLGVRQAGVNMVDYYPLLPWFGVALLGIFAGYIFYPKGVCRFIWPDLAQAITIRGLRFLGRHSLLIYLIHQPILLGLLTAWRYAF